MENTVNLNEILNDDTKSLEFRQASFKVEEDEIIVSTGKVEGKWRWTGKGFVSSGLKNLSTGKEWVGQQSEQLADWDLRIFEDEVELISITAELSTDENFTSEHIRVVAEINYAMPLANASYCQGAFGTFTL